MINYSYYPYLDGARRTITNLDEQCVLYARDNIEKYSPTEDLELDISVFLASTMILRNLNNNFLTRKFVNNFGKLFESKFLKDIHNKDIRMEILDYFNVKKDIEFIFVNKTRLVKIHMINYLEIQQLVNNDQRALELVNQVLDRGFVIIELERFVYMMRLAFEHRLFDKIKGMKVYDGHILINRCVSELSDKYPLQKQSTKIGSNGQAPCIKNLIHIAETQHHLGHNARILLGNYLMGKEYDMEHILDIYSKLSDYKEKTTLTQLKSIKKYNCYSCQSCQTMGLCIDKDQRCSQISNPFFY